jgi:putative phage-type endonuclease
MRIGGSNIAGICGISPWSTPLEEFMKITGRMTIPDNPAMYWGRALEPVIRRKYEDETGREVMFNYNPEKFGITVVHPEYHYLVGSLDGITRDDRVVEIKTAAREWPDGVPEHYLCQVQFYMACTGAQVADVAALFGASQFEIFEVPRDDQLIEMMIQIASDFWEKHIETDIPPDCTTPGDRNVRWNRSVANAVEFPTAQEIIEKIKGIKTGLAAMESEKDELEAVLKDIMEDSDTLTIYGKPAVTWKQSKDIRSFDKDKFSKEHPGLYREYTTTKPGTRRFLIK